MNKKIILQFFTGGFLSRVDYSEGIIEKINLIKNRASISKVIMGWGINPDSYIKVMDNFKESNIEFYLWFPIFSEIGLLGNAKLSEDINRKELKGYNLSEEENFEFYCPTNSINHNLVKKIYNEYFKSCNFDGIFMDKIRSASFANGFEAGTSCLCDNCREHYENDLLDDVSKKLSTRVMEIEDSNATTINFKSNEVASFFSEKQNVYSDSIDELVDYFKQQGLKVGMDTFAPKLAPLVGQDLKRLSQVADFIKPMMYRHTHAPAGMEFEYKSFLEFTNFPSLSIDILSQEQTKEDISFLENLDCEVYIGIEVNTIKEIAEVGEEEIKESVNVYGNNKLSGFNLSWNLLAADDKNILTAIKTIADLE